MKKTNLIITSAAALVALVAISGVAFSSFAAEDTSADNSITMPRQGRQMMNSENRVQREEKFKLTQAEFEAKRAAIDVAIKANDYNAWVEAVGGDCPMLQNINEGNFSKFVEAYNLREQARSIMEELGVERGEKGFGMGGGRDHFMR